MMKTVKPAEMAKFRSLLECHTQSDIIENRLAFLDAIKEAATDIAMGLLKDGDERIGSVLAKPKFLAEVNKMFRLTCYNCGSTCNLNLYPLRVVDAGGKPHDRAMVGYIYLCEDCEDCSWTIQHRLSGAIEGRKIAYKLKPAN